MQTLYVVIEMQHGYIEGVYGPFNSKNKAIVASLKVKRPSVAIVRGIDNE